MILGLMVYACYPSSMELLGNHACLFIHASHLCFTPFPWKIDAADGTKPISKLLLTWTYAAFIFWIIWVFVWQVEVTKGKLCFFSASSLLNCFAWKSEKKGSSYQFRNFHYKDKMVIFIMGIPILVRRHQYNQPTGSHHGTWYIDSCAALWHELLH